jgi:hypothetical protein
MSSYQNEYAKCLNKDWPKDMKHIFFLLSTINQKSINILSEGTIEIQDP